MAVNQGQDIEDILSTVDDTTFDEDDWNIVIKECSSLSAKWENVSGYLGLSFSLIDDIKGSFPNNLAGCWNEALKNWIMQNYKTHRFGLPSWRTLLEAVSRVDQLLFKKLADTHQVHSAVGGTVGGAVTVSDTDREMEASQVPPQETHSITLVSSADAGRKPHLTFPCLDLSKMSKEEKQQLHQRLYSESMDMVDKFQDLFSETTQSLKVSKVSVKELLCHLVGLGPHPPAYKDLNLPMFMRQLPELMKSKTIDEAMLVIGNYCSFFNFRMLEHIINKLGTQQDKKNLSKYRDEFDQYAKRHVFECPSEVGTVSESLASIFVTLDRTFEGFTVTILELFVENLRKILKISTGAVFKLCRVEPGSLKLTFQLPYSMLQDIFPLADQQEEALSHLGVEKLWLIYQFNRQTLASVNGEESATGNLVSMATNVVSNKSEETGSIADSGQETASFAATFKGESRLSEDILERDLKDEPYLRMEQDAAKLRPPDDSSGLQLHQASHRGDLDEVKRLIEEEKLNPLQKDSNGHNALHHAAMGGHLPVAKYLIEEQSLNPACPGWMGLTPLHEAAYCNHLELVDYLVAEQQVDPQCQDEDGYTPLHKASQGGDVKVVRYLVSEMCKHTLLKDVVGDRTKNGSTPLHLAALHGHLPVVKLFIMEYNVDPNTPGWQDRTPLHNAAEEGHLEIVKYLIVEKNCNPSCLDEMKSAPLHVACTKGHLNIVQYLTKEQHCNPVCYDKVLGIPLHWAAYNGHLQVVKYFSEDLSKCPQNIRGVLNTTPLEEARSQGHTNVVQYLMSVV